MRHSLLPALLVGLSLAPGAAAEPAKIGQAMVVYLQQRPTSDWPALLPPGSPPPDEVERRPLPVAPEVSLGLAGKDEDARNQLGGEDTETEEEAFDACADPRPRRNWLDRFGYGVYRTVCGTAQWVDGFFGGDRSYQFTDTSYGRVGLGMAWDEKDGFRVRGRFKARVTLPRAENRFNAFLGRYEEDEFLSGQSDDIGAIPALFQETREKDWLLGLGYNPVNSARSRLDVDAGVKVDFPMDPFVKATYRYYLFVSNTRLLRFSQTAFWTNHLGTGTTTRFDLEKAIGDSFHVRWLSMGTLAEKVEGLEWRSSVTVFHHLGGKRAIAWVAEIEGETEAVVDLEQYGLRAIYRQRYLRDDLFLELEARVFFPEIEGQEGRKATAGVGIAFEMLWGRQDLLAARERLRKGRTPPPPAKTAAPPTQPPARRPSGG
jgi:hypothetical protein